MKKILQRDFKANFYSWLFLDKYLSENNYVLNNKDKKTFMEQSSVTFSLYIDIGSHIQRENTSIGHDITPPKYEGYITLFSDFPSVYFS